MYFLGIIALSNMIVTKIKYDLNKTKSQAPEKPESISPIKRAYI